MQSPGLFTASVAKIIILHACASLFVGNLFYREHSEMIMTFQHDCNTANFFTDYPGTIKSR